MVRTAPQLLLALTTIVAACSFKPLGDVDASLPPSFEDALAVADGDEPGTGADAAPLSDGLVDQAIARGDDALDAPLSPSDTGGADDVAAHEDRAGPEASAGDSAPGLKSNGQTCGAGAECLTGSCVDGVCCNTACQGQCQACDNPSSKGVCVPVTGVPHGSRAPCAGAGTLCAGSCDGILGASCNYPSTDVLCGVATCKDNDTAQPAAACNGKGSCVTPAPVSCAPYTCGPTACAGGCSPSNPCTGNNYCDAGKCTPKLGAAAACTSDGQCGTGHCADGVCCDRACPGDCEACNLAGKVGVCSFQQGNVCRDALGACDVDEVCPGNASTCPADALRPSSFVCRPAQGVCVPELRCTGNSVACPSPPPPSTLMCPASCTGNTFTPASVCTGAGTCSGQPQSCGNHVCALSGCKIPCAGDGDCLGGFTCSGGACVACPSTPSYCSSGMSNGTVCASGDGAQLGTCSQAGICVSGSTSMCPAGKYCSGAYPSAACVSPTAVGYGYNESPPGNVHRGPTTGMYGGTITVTSTLNVRVFGAVVYLPSTSRATFALFADAGGAPGALVAKAEAVTFYSTDVIGRNEYAAAPATPGTTPRVTPGTYWLMLAIETDTIMSIQSDGVHGSAQQQFPFTVGSPVPNPAPTASGFVSAGMQNGLYILGTPP